MRTPVGDRYVVEAMRQGGYNLGGEQSGHLVFLDHASTGDGIDRRAAGARAHAPHAASRSPSWRAQAMERVPQVLENVTLPRPPAARGDGRRCSALIARVETALGEEGRVLVRWSGTEPKLRVMVEGPDEARIGTIAQDLVAAAREDVG